MEQIEDKVKLVISEQFGVSVKEILNTHSFTKDLGADSLESVSLLVALEEAFGVEISDEDAVKIKTVQNAIDYSKMVLERKG